jgi:hypothetical protein
MYFQFPFFFFIIFASRARGIADRTADRIGSDRICPVAKLWPAYYSKYWRDNVHHGRTHDVGKLGWDKSVSVFSLKNPPGTRRR